MKISYKREKIAEGIHFSTINNPNLKTNSIVINLICPLSEKTASLNAVSSYFISDSSREYPSLAELSSRLEELYGARIKGTVCGSGDNQFITMICSCINDRFAFDNEKVTQELANVFLGCVLDPHIEENGFYSSDFALKKQELIDDIDAAINEKRSYALSQAAKIIYKGEPAEVRVKGDRRSAENVTSNSAYAQYKNMLKTAQIEAFFVGGGNAEEIQELVASKLSTLERNYNGDCHSEISSLKASPEIYTEELDVAQCKMVLAFKSDNADYFAAKLMNAIFGGTAFSKLFLNVREKLSLCYYCSSSFNSLKNVITVDSGVEEANIEKAREEILRQFELVQNGDFDEKEINEARLALINSLRGVNDSAASIVDWYNGQILKNTEYSPENEIEMLEKVTKEDIIRAAKSFKLDTVYVLKGKENTENE